MSKSVLIVCDSFKESLDAAGVAQAIARGIGSADATARCTPMPFSDGGEGAIGVLEQAVAAGTLKGGHRVACPTVDALGRPITAEYFRFTDRPAAWIELSAASGIHLIPPKDRDPKITSTYGTGLMIRHALDQGAQEIILGIGGSATNDAGAGIIQAMGSQLLDQHGHELPYGGLALSELDKIKLPEGVQKINWRIACDVNNPLLGPSGASRVYGPQKGAHTQDIDQLERALTHFAQKVEDTTGVHIGSIPGGGAAGGTAAGLYGFFKAELISGFDLLGTMTDLEEKIKTCDYVFTAEGRIDHQSLQGKVPISVAQLGQKHNKPVIGVAGSIEPPYNTYKKLGLTSLFSVQNGPMTLEDSKGKAAQLIEETAYRVWSLIKTQD
jgi:glycerate kinase